MTDSKALAPNNLQASYLMFEQSDWCQYGFISGLSFPSESVQTLPGIFFNKAMHAKLGLEARLKFVVQHYLIPCVISLTTTQ